MRLLVHNKAAEYAAKIIQSGGNKIFDSTSRALNEFAGTDLYPRDWGRALESLKTELKLASDFHGVIFDNGDYADAAGNVLGNILEYLP
jgi:hypothetical protein